MLFASEVGSTGVLLHPNICESGRVWAYVLDAQRTDGLRYTSRHLIADLLVSVNKLICQSPNYATPARVMPEKKEELRVGMLQTATMALGHHRRLGYTGQPAPPPHLNLQDRRLFFSTVVSRG